jgi:ferredoxin
MGETKNISIDTSDKLSSFHFQLTHTTHHSHSFKSQSSEEVESSLHSSATSNVKVSLPSHVTKSTSGANDQSSIAIMKFISSILLAALVLEGDAFCVVQSTPKQSMTRWASNSQTSDAMVDMNAYNLPLDQIAQEWTANLIAESSLRERGIYLGAKSSKAIMVDTVKVELPRKIGQGLGLELLEIAGGREDGFGIVVINGIVQGGAAEGSEILLGDSISKISIRKTSRQAEDNILSDVEEIDSVGTECYGYDKTIETIVGLPPAESDGESLILTLKRLRRKPKVTVTLQYPPSQDEPDVTIELFAGENLRRAMLTRGVKMNDPFVARFDNGGSGDCGAEGTCATCAVNIVKGEELLSPAKTQEQQIFVNKPRWRMACKAVVGHGMREGEMIIKVNPHQWD